MVVRVHPGAFFAGPIFFWGAPSWARSRLLQSEPAVARRNKVQVEQASRARRQRVFWGGKKKKRAWGSKRVGPTRGRTEDLGVISTTL